MRIGIDFDGTLAKDAFPNVGEEIPYAFSTLKRWQKEGHQLVLWTVRSGSPLDDAVDFIRRKGIDLYGINAVPGQEEHSTSPKIHCDIYVDDKAIGCPLTVPERGKPYVDWLEVEVKVFSKLTGLYGDD